MLPLYVTKDGNFFTQNLIPLQITANSASPTSNGNNPATDVPKSDKPLVELFVMTHCPYGTQAEKGIIPALKALGSKIDGTIRFVHYFMHGDKEEQETYAQVCIREEQPTKFLDYLSCFLEASDSVACLTRSGIDKTKLNTCISNGNAKKYYDADAVLSQGYGVQGSPTLVINGVESKAGRDSQSYLSGVCAAFNNAPSECSQTLSSTAPSPGFGSSASSSASAASAQCNTA